MVTYDEHKRRINLDKHGLDFIDCEVVFEGPLVSREDDREFYGEQRINALGFLGVDVVHVTYTMRGDGFHIISLRKAEKHEIRFFAKMLGIG